jgi:hypothetical protein
VKLGGVSPLNTSMTARHFAFTVFATNARWPTIYSGAIRLLRLPADPVHENA